MAALAGLALVFTTGIQAAPRPNFVFLLADDLRPDALRVLGHPVIETPHLDALARGGTLFTRAITAYPICVVSRAEMITGRPAFLTGYQYRGKGVAKDLALWPRTLRAAGYHTWHVGKWHVPGGSPWELGYEETRGHYSGGGGGAKAREPQTDYAGRPVTGYRGWTFKTNDNQPEPDKGVGLTPDISARFADAAIELLDRKPDQPFFLHVNFTAPHDPLLRPPGFADRYAAAKVPLPGNFAPQHPFDHGNFDGRDEVILPRPRTPEAIRRELAVYYSIITHLDAQIGRVVAALKRNGQWENTVLIFASDHGLALGSHGLTGKQNQYEHSIGVPLILAGRGIPANRRHAAQVYLRDLFPTTCELAGVPVPATVQSLSLVPLLRDGAREIHPFVVGCFTDTQRMIREGNWKLIWYPKLARYQLFDLKNDPLEIRDLFGNQLEAKRVADLRQKLEHWLKANGDPLFDPKP